jgi:Type II secretory pathway, component PulF
MSTQTFQPQTNLLDAEQVRYDFQGTNILGTSLVKHYIYAATPDHAEAVLTRAKIEVDAITPHREGFRRRKRALSREELGTFAIQLAERTKASDPIPKAILDIARSTTNRLLREALLDVYAEIKKESVNLDQAFNIRADVFPDAFRHIIRVGTTKGDPSDMLSKSANVSYSPLRTWQK